MPFKVLNFKAKCKGEQDSGNIRDQVKRQLYDFCSVVVFCCKLQFSEEIIKKLIRQYV